MPADEERRKELAGFLKTRRMRISPQEAGLPSDSQRRRTPGLRREEVAVLAGISLPWYTSLEQGRDIRVSDQVLDSLARTLRLDAAERKHLFMLANQQSSSISFESNKLTTVPFSLAQHVEQLDPCPAYILDSKCNVLAWNRMAVELFGDYGAMEEEERNAVWLMFTRSDYRERIVEWDELAKSVIAQFRNTYGKNIHDPWYTNMVNRLSQISPEFREWWSLHNVQYDPDSNITIRHSQAGMLTLQTNIFTVLDYNGSFYVKSMMPVIGTDTMDKLVSIYKSLPEASSESKNIAGLQMQASQSSVAVSSIT